MPRVSLLALALLSCAAGAQAGVLTVPTGGWGIKDVQPVDPAAPSPAATRTTKD